MIDLETLGVDPITSPIIQIGAAPFQLDEDGPMSGLTQLFRTHVNASSCLVAPFNRRIEPGTVAWWARTDAELLAEIMTGVGLPMAQALYELREWVLGIGQDIQGVWSNGATFDITMLEIAYRQAGIHIPWPFRAVRDVRTMAMIAGDDDACWNGGTVSAIERDGKKHDALVDCLRQIRLVQQTWQRRVKHPEHAHG